MASRGSRLVEAMRMRGLQKQHALAFSLRVSESTITRWKNDGPISLEKAISLCDALDMSMDWFLFGHGSMERLRSETSPSPDEQRLLGFFRQVDARMSGSIRALLFQVLDALAAEM